MNSQSKNTKVIIVVIITAIVAVATAIILRGKAFVPEITQNINTPTPPRFGELPTPDNPEPEPVMATDQSMQPDGLVADVRVSTRPITETNGIKHSINLEDILSGGPSKDGIPSIDDPQFFRDIQAANSFMLDGGDTIGLGIAINDDTRFYPFKILVWHEIVNDIVGNMPLAVTYCPLCRTGVVFDRTINGKVVEFGVSGKLWQSNVLMYDRQANEDNESYWSQVLAEAVWGPATGTTLDIVSSDIVRYQDWIQKHPNTLVLSPETGFRRDYTNDPYGQYYADNSAILFGDAFTDTRLPSKELVIGLELDGQFYAYPKQAILENQITQTLPSGSIVTASADGFGDITVIIDGKEWSFIEGFWFSWVLAHPDTEVYLN